jgi:hypothetical protein
MNSVSVLQLLAFFIFYLKRFGEWAVPPSSGKAYSSGPNQ